MRYPPEGIRGMSAGTRATGFGRIPDYVKRCQDELCLLLQVETVEALGQIEAIAAVEGVDLMEPHIMVLRGRVGLHGDGDQTEGDGAFPNRTHPPSMLCPGRHMPVSSTVHLADQVICLSGN